MEHELISTVRIPGPGIVRVQWTCICGSTGIVSNQYMRGSTIARARRAHRDHAVKKSIKT